MRTEMGRNDYRFTLAHGHPDRFIFTDEAFRFNSDTYHTEAPWKHLGSGHSEARILEARNSQLDQDVNPTTARVIVHLLRNCSVYHFHDTSRDSHFMNRWDAEDNHYLRGDGGNLAAVFLRIETEDVNRFESICGHIGQALPVFDRFHIVEDRGTVILRWKARGIEKTFGAHLTSDGSLRFFALVTLLNLHIEMLSDVIFLDEPELGLHPTAVSILREMIELSREKSRSSLPRSLRCRPTHSVSMRS